MALLRSTQNGNEWIFGKRWEIVGKVVVGESVTGKPLSFFASLLLSR